MSLRAVSVFGLVGLAASSNYATFTPEVALYALNSNCSAGFLVATFKGPASGASPVCIGLDAYPGFAGMSLTIPPCDLDVASSGQGAYIDTGCTANVASVAPLAYPVCLPASGGYPLTGPVGQVTYTCKFEPCCSTSGWVISTAVVLSIATAGLCGFWVWKDRSHKAKEKASFADRADAIAAEEARAASNTSGILSLAGSSHAITAHGGYNSLPA